MSESSLIAQLQAYSNHLKAHSETSPRDLAWTLQMRRSHFPLKIAFSATTNEQLVSRIDAKLEMLKTNPGTTLGVRASIRQATPTPRILGVFTGMKTCIFPSISCFGGDSEHVTHVPRKIPRLSEAMSTDII